MAFKQDEDFLRFITMGAAGSAAVARFLDEQHGHQMVELERYAMANKIWATKLKRLRVPDLLCLECGLRVEARTKSKLEIKVSDAENNPDRAWDAGLRDEDLVALIHWDPEHMAPSDHVECFGVGDMRATVTHSKLGPRKSASEGAERDRTWPARVPKHDGRVIWVDREAQIVHTQLVSGRRQSYRIPTDQPAYFYVDDGEDFRGSVQLLLGVVPQPPSLDCPGPTWNYGAELESDDPITRYIAVKAAGLRRDGRYLEELRLIAEGDEDVRIQVEALAGLARLEPDTSTAAVHTIAQIDADASKSEQEMAMEAIFILSELKTEAAADALADIAGRENAPSEVRSAAVWGLGVAGVDDPVRVLPFIADKDEDVALHAIAGVGDLDAGAVTTLAERLGSAATDREAASAAALLADQGERAASVLLTLAERRDRAGVWAQVALGALGEETVRTGASAPLSEHLEAILSPMWASGRSWLQAQQGSTPLEFLKRQTIRHSP